MVLSKIIAVVLLVSFFCQIGGQVMPDSDSSQSTYSGDDHYSGSGGVNERYLPCCISENFTFYSIAYALGNITSDNTIVYITANVVLSPMVRLEGLENITIAGHRSPVVDCTEFGAIKFISCKNVTIEGIQWDGCGSMNHPGIEFYNSSNVSFKRCSFHNSKTSGRSILLSEMLGGVYIKNCQFTHRYKHRGHGAAIYYSNSHTQQVLVIQNSTFMLNRATQSVVYIDSSRSSHVYLQDNAFWNNRGVPIYISHTILNIRGHVLFEGNSAQFGGGIYSRNSSIIFCDKADVEFVSNSATNNGGVIHQINSRTFFEANSKVTFSENIARLNGGALYAYNSNISFDSTANVVHAKNKAGEYGGAVYCQSSSHITFDGNSNVTFFNNKARYYGGAVFCWSFSYIMFDGSSNVAFNKNEASEDGGSVCCGALSHIVFDGNSSVTFNNEVGRAVYSDLSRVTFDGNSRVTFSNNKAIEFSGGAIYCRSLSQITFDGNSSVTFNNNTSLAGGAVSCWYSSRITFVGNSNVTFKNNKASDTGGAVHCWRSSHITFDGNSSISFDNNTSVDGGAVKSHLLSAITFDGSSIVSFNNNVASHYGGAISFYGSSHIMFNGSSSVRFNNNGASINGGAVYCRSSSHITFGGDSVVTFDSNDASDNGGSIYISDSSFITFTNSTSVVFNNNTVDNNGAAIFCLLWSNIRFNENSSVVISNNKGSRGGAVHCNKHCNVSFNGQTSVKFINNNATTGGAMLSQANSYILARENSTVRFVHNRATQGGAVYSQSQATVLLEERCAMTFENNKATESGGALYITAHSTAAITGHSKVTYSNNEVTQYGGTVYCGDNSGITVDKEATVEFRNNTSEYGGAMTIMQSIMIFKGSSLVMFTNNIAERGGAVYVLMSSVAFEGHASVKFTNNKAENGGAIACTKSSVTFSTNSQLWFFKNLAATNGGAMHLSDHFNVNISNNSHITFSHNTANGRGGTVYSDLTKGNGTLNRFTFKISDVDFINSTDLTGSDVYVDVPTSCDKSCLSSSIIYNEFSGIIKTSPRKLELNNTATCIDNDNDTNNCQTYLTKNIMLGQEIVISACVLDMFNQPAGPTQFILSSEDQVHHIIGSDNVLLSCTVFEGVSIMGRKVLDATNYSMSLTSYDGSISDLKKFSIELITELSPCHSGFHYNNTTQTCVCYSDSDVVSCSGSTSSIKRGYWFGEVNGKATVTICPNRFCNFTCCETAKGFFELSPVRANQCNSHRSGSACGSCMEGFTLSFDSTECVSVNKCTTRQTILVVTLSMIYWIVIVIIVFIMTYYHIGIGYLYAITYYYSVVDILLSDRLYISQGLFTFVSILSSIAKVMPPVLGQLCLVTNMTGIDQQFIHYVHPLAVATIVAGICLSARMSYKFSSLIGRGIIHVICFLLLLSYTSVATTSLLLLRSLTFDNVDKVYTYLSPGIEFLQGRHLPYFILAILCTLVIVIGLPLLLLLEPFINHKFNFTRIKPLLDQFQGCYKDRYRSFAAYYMICRLVTIFVIVANPTNNHVSLYVLIISNSLLAFIHMVLQPYGSNILNVFDGFVLQLIIVASMVPLVENYSPDLLLVFMLVLVLVPLVTFLGVEIYLYKKTVKRITKLCLPSNPDTVYVNDHTEVPMRDFVDSVIDDSRRVNATVCETKMSRNSEDVQYRESFMEVMVEIEE